MGRALLGLLPRTGEGHRQDACPTPARTCSRCTERDWQHLRGRRMSMVMQDPKYSLNPVKTVGKQIGETCLLHMKIDRKEARRRTLAMLEAVQIRDPELVYRPLSAPALGRHGPARDDRHDADRRARPADRRRADLGARRDGAERGAAHPRRSRARARHGAHPDQPQPDDGRELLRPGADHVWRPDRRAMRGEGPAERAAPLYPRAGRRDAVARRAARPELATVVRDPAWLA